MTTYRVATGSNVALVSLTTLDPQPRSEGIKPTRRFPSASGAVYDESRYVELEYNIVGSAASYVAILTLFGVNSALFANVTVYVRDEVFAWVRMNGIAVRPEPGRDVRWSAAFPRQVVILIKDLAVAS